MSAGIVLTDGARPRVACLVPMPERCTARGDALRAYAERMGITANPVVIPSTVALRMVWDAPAASEFPRPILADACDAAELRPDLAGAVWHAAAGAIITAPGCDCDTPAGFRDVFAAIGRTIGDEFGRCDVTRRDSHGLTRRCELTAGHADDHESWGTGPDVLAGLVWSNRAAERVS